MKYIKYVVLAIEPNLWLYKSYLILRLYSSLNEMSLPILAPDLK